MILTKSWNKILKHNNNTVWYVTIWTASVAALVALYAGMMVVAANNGDRCMKETIVGLLELMRASKFSASLLQTSIWKGKKKGKKLFT